ncbi:hypothetical protein V3C41_11405 [Paenarthrobacter nicotinovorans]|uniref:Transmembrane protein n=1 Tax=Paenarthrobacter nicotinovorans TaxID=29320 RepID=A0ABV0GT19_PAENI
MIVRAMNCGDPQQVPGLDVTLTPRLYILNFAALEVRNGDSDVEYMNLRDQLIAVPTFVAVDTEGGDFDALTSPVTKLDPSDLDLPLTERVHSRLTFRTLDGIDNYNLVIRGNLRMPFLVSDRFRYFADITGTIGILSREANSSKIAVSSIKSSSSEDAITRVAGIMASAESLQLENIIAKSKRWDACVIGNPSLYADLRDFNDDQYEVYEVQKYLKRIPQCTLDPVCFLCDSKENITIEHCTPNWLMTALGLHPITAPIVCEECNNRLGFELEKPMSDLYARDEVLENTSLASIWAVKTAVTLALASNISVPPDLKEAIATGNLDGTGAEVFASKIPRGDEGVFQFTVTRLRRALAGTCFLLSFAFSGYGFLVVRWDSLEVGQLPLIDRIFPTTIIGADVPLTAPLLPQLLERLSGDGFEFSSISHDPIKSPRT